MKSSFELLGKRLNEHLIVLSVLMLLSGVILIFFSFAIFPWQKLIQNLLSASMPSQDSFPQEASLPHQNIITVEIQGAVISPGVYQLASNSRVVALIQAAKGFSRLVDQKWIKQNFNQALILEDGQKIYVPFQGEEGGDQNTSSKKIPTKKASPKKK